VAPVSAFRSADDGVVVEVDGVVNLDETAGLGGYAGIADVEEDHELNLGRLCVYCL
jgi:hypothetical protein